MKVMYDASVDVLRILFNDAPIAESDEALARMKTLRR
jgi:uncharacterized protein YuzE